MTMAFDEWWDPVVEDWTTNDDGISLSFSASGDTLAIVPPGETEAIDLAKVVFSIPPELAKTWYGTGQAFGVTMDLAGTGELTYYDGDQLLQSGPWDASEGYLRSVDQLSESSVGYLNPYTLQDGDVESTLIVDIEEGGQLTYSDVAE